MRRWLLLVVLIGVTALSASGQEPDELPEAPKSRELGPVNLVPYGSISIEYPLTVGQTARVFAIGDGRTAIGLYIYDRHGNCVSRDDRIDRLLDDRVVVYVPAETAEYTLEMRNFGSTPNRTLLVVRDK